MFDYRAPQKPQAQRSTRDVHTDSVRTVLSEAYVPHQPFEAVYSPEQALPQGTVFRELDKPFKGFR